MTYKIKELDEFREVQLEHPRVVKVIKDRRFYIEDEYGNRLYGAWNKEDLQKHL